MKKIIVFSSFIVGCLLVFLYWAHLPLNSHVSYIVNKRNFLQADKSFIKILTYNIAYGRGREDDIVVGQKNKELIEENLDKIGRLLKNSNADIILLQEVDLASKRSYFIDEAKYLAEHAGYLSYACVTSWVKNYIPFPYWPPSNHFGRMKSGQCILSKLPITNNERIELPQRKDKPFFYTAFYLDRVIQAADIKINGETYKVFNVHQEAFDIKNREEQTSILAGLVNKSFDKVIVGGDFNALPPGAKIKKDFSDGPEKEWNEWKDVSSDRSMELFFVSVPKLEEALSSNTVEQETFTYPSNAPNRRIDYIFFSKELNVYQSRVLKEAGEISDHLPVYVELKL